MVGSTPRAERRLRPGQGQEARPAPRLHPSETDTDGQIESELTDASRPGRARAGMADPACEDAAPRVVARQSPVRRHSRPWRGAPVAGAPPPARWCCGAARAAIRPPAIAGRASSAASAGIQAGRSVSASSSAARSAVSVIAPPAAAVAGAASAAPDGHASTPRQTMPLASPSPHCRMTNARKAPRPAAMPPWLDTNAPSCRPMRRAGWRAEAANAARAHWHEARARGCAASEGR